MPPASGIREIQAQIPARKGGEHQLPSSQQPGLPELSRPNFPRDFLKAFGFVPKKRNKAQYRNLQLLFFFFSQRRNPALQPAARPRCSNFVPAAGSEGSSCGVSPAPSPTFGHPKTCRKPPQNLSLPQRFADTARYPHGQRDAPLKEGLRGLITLKIILPSPPQHCATLPAPFPKPQVPGASPEGAAAPRGWAPSCGPEVGVTARGGQGEAPPGCPGVYFYLLGTRCPVHDRAPPPAALRVPKRRPDGAGSGRACAGAPGSGGGELGKEPFFYWDGLVPSWACRLVAGGLGKGVRVKPGMGRGSGDGRWGRAQGAGPEGLGDPAVGSAGHGAVWDWCSCPLKVRDHPEGAAFISPGAPARFCRRETEAVRRELGVWWGGFGDPPVPWGSGSPPQL